MPQHLDPYLKQFGLKPGATFQQITARYFACLEEFPYHMTAEQRAAKESFEHAYQILKRAYQSEAPKGRMERKVVKKPRVATRSKAMTSGVVVGLFVAAGIFIGMNYSEIKLKVSNYEVGDVVRWKDSSGPYGKVLQYDPMHRYGIGGPAPAYEIQLDGTTETVWVSERVVEKAMVPVESD
jgi:hypothetical protein